MTAVRTDPSHVFRRRDVLAGLSVALVLVPQSLAYAELAGMPSHHGLYAAAIAPIAAAFFASSPYLQTGPVALTGLLTLGALVPLAGVRTPEYVGLAALLALVVGLVRILVGSLGAGWVSYLMSRPLLTGFTSAAAILIVASQLPGALGVPVEGGVLPAAGRALARPGAWEGAAVALAVGTVVVVTGARRVHPLLPGVLIAALGGIAYSVLAGYEGATIGRPPATFPPLTLDLPWTRLPTLVLPGAVIALVGFAEASAISRVFAREERQRWDPDREFLSQGAANVAVAFAGGFPVGGSFARSSVARAAGGQSRWSGLVAGVAVLLFLPAVGLIAPLPTAVLSGIVIAAVWQLFRPRELTELWRASRPQAVLGWSTFGLTLLLSPHIEQAVVLAMLMAAVVHLWRERRPRVAARTEGTSLHVDVTGVLWFGSGPALEDELLSLLADTPEATEVVLHCKGLGRIDLTAAYGLVELRTQLEAVGVGIRFVDVPPHALRVLGALDAVDEVGEVGEAGDGP